MNDAPRLDRSPQGEFALHDPIIDLGFALGPTGTPPRIRLETKNGTVIWATVPDRALLERFVRQWQKLLGF